MPNVYLETTIPSYLAAHPSRDLIIAAHQQITHEWWRDARNRFDIYVSEAVLDEIRCGDADAATRRLAILDGLPVLELNNDVRALVHAYDEKLGLVGRARADLPHFAFAVAYEMDYLITWNCAHIANGEIVRRLRETNLELGRFTPIIVTPKEILETPEDQRI
ncbi:MAG TPA: type II toxin-antitoxin system VapC family toxin [Pirellulales bacterium]|nr:type II toxin-antitoxin system VapC family toxin [Pirellulales bacterium]